MLLATRKFGPVPVPICRLKPCQSDPVPFANALLKKYSVVPPDEWTLKTVSIGASEVKLYATKTALPSTGRIIRLSLGPVELSLLSELVAT